MADPTYEPEDLRFALFREYQTKPFYRRACVISFAPETADKYRLTEVDMNVCDTGFMSVISLVMATPQPIRVSKPVGKSIRMEILDEPTKRGTEQHFILSVEAIPKSVNVEPSRMVI